MLDRLCSGVRKNSVGLSVGRSNNKVSTFGTLTPSLNRSTVNVLFVYVVFVTMRIDFPSRQ